MKKFLPVLFLYLSAVSLFALFQFSGTGDESVEATSEDGPVVAGPEFQIPEVPVLEPGHTLVGSWNLRLKPPPAFMRPGNYHDPLLIAQIIQASGADLWALQELFDDYIDAEGGLRNEYMDAVVLILNRRTGSEWIYWVGDAKDRWGQNTGFLWNSGTVEVLLEPSVLSDFDRPTFELTEKMLWRRRPAAAIFRFRETGTRLLVVSAHQKGYNSEATQAHRLVEAGMLLEELSALKAVHSMDGIVLAGRLADESAESASLAYVDAGFRDLNPSDVPNLMSTSEDGSVGLYWATARILVDGLDADLFPDVTVSTLGDAWLAERAIDLHNYIYYVSNYLPLVTRVR